MKTPQQSLRQSQHSKGTTDSGTPSSPILQSLTKTVLALATFSPLTTVTSATEDPRTNQQKQLAQKAIDNQRERQITAIPEFIANPAPQLLFDACKNAFREHGIKMDLVLNQRNGKVQIECNEKSPDGLTTPGHRDLFFPEQDVVIRKSDGMPCIREVAKDALGIERERYKTLIDLNKDRSNIIQGVGTKSFQELSRIADSGRDGVVSEEDLRNAIKDPMVRGADAQLLSGFFRGLRGIERLGDRQPGISQGDVDALMKPGNKVRLEVDKNIYSSSFTVGNATSLYGVKGYPTPFDGSAVHMGQGQLVAAINALCAARPYVIGEMITPNASGESYKVRFGSKTVEVPAPTESELATYIRCGKDGYWMAVLVKAYGTVLGEASGNSTINSESNTAGGHSLRTPKNIMGFLGGLPIRQLSFDIFGSSADSVHQELVKATAENRAVCLATSSSERLNGDRRIGGINLQANELYSVIGYNPDTREVTVLAPVRTITNRRLDEDLDNGIAKVPLNDVLQNFRRMYIEGGDPLPALGRKDNLAKRFPQ